MINIINIFEQYQFWKCILELGRPPMQRRHRSGLSHLPRCGVLLQRRVSQGTGCFQAAEGYHRQDQG